MRKLGEGTGWEHFSFSQHACLGVAPGLGAISEGLWCFPSWATGHWGRMAEATCGAGTETNRKNQVPLPTPTSTSGADCRLLHGTLGALVSTLPLSYIPSPRFCISPENVAWEEAFIELLLYFPTLFLVLGIGSRAFYTPHTHSIRDSSSSCVPT